MRMPTDNLHVMQKNYCIIQSLSKIKCKKVIIHREMLRLMNFPLLTALM